MNDFSGVYAGLSVSPALAAIIGAGALVGAVYFARWLVKCVAGFFDDDDEDAYELECLAAGICPSCGDDIGQEFCPTCDADYLAWIARDDGDDSEEYG